MNSVAKTYELAEKPEYQDLMTVYSPLIGKRINVERTEQALATGANLVVTACPYCLTMIDDGTKTKNVEETVKTKDIAEILWESVQ